MRWLSNASKVAKPFQVRDNDGGHLNTFIIDPQGKIAKIFVKVNPAAHSEEVLAALTALQKS